MAEKEDHDSKYYPTLTIPNNKTPNRWLGIPFVGILIRFILTLPVLLWMFVLSIAFFVLWFITPFVILFRRKYWDTAYNFTVGYIKLYTKLGMYYYGLIDTYPGFGLSDDGLFTLAIAKPTKPNLLLGFPILGLFIRIIVMIPYAIYETVLSRGSQIAVFLSWFAVLFKGKYPDRLYQFNHDTIRVGMAQAIYLSYLSDRYPSFKISTKYKKTVIALLIGGIILTILNSVPNENKHQYQPDNSYDQSTMPEMFDHQSGY